MPPTNTWWLLPARRPTLGAHPGRGRGGGVSVALESSMTSRRFVLSWVCNLLVLDRRVRGEGKEKLPLVLPGAGHGGWR